MIQQARLLVVEDDPELGGALRAALARQYEVHLATDAPEARALMAKFRFDMLLLDLILPTGTGTEFLDRLASNPAEAPPVVVMSGLGNEVDLSRFEPIIASYLIKPFGLDEVERRVREALAGRRQVLSTVNRSSAGTVLLVDDDPDLLSAMAESLGRSGYEARVAVDTAQAMDMLLRDRFDAVVTDWIMPGSTGLELLQRIREVVPGMPVLLLTGYATPDFTRRALQTGAADVLVKPFPPGALPVALEKCLHRPVPGAAPPVKAVPAPRARERKGADTACRYSLESIIGTSPAIQRARNALVRVANLDSSVMIHGETGTGKELFAQALHNLSGRSAGPFVALNAAAIPESLLESELFGYAAGAFTGARKEGQRGKFLQADGGTLFLDEIGDLPLSLQVKLLRVLQEGEVDLVGSGSCRVNVRVVAATHRNLDAMVAQGSFRRDLYYRLNVVTLELPPLRERQEDVPVLARRFLDELLTRYDRQGVAFSHEALDLLMRHSWPGNVRELRNVVERAFAFALGELILPADLPPALRGGAERPVESAASSDAQDLASHERQAIVRALESTGGNKLQAAKLLGISRAGLYVKLKIYGIA